VALTDEAIGKIKEMIISGRVRPGEKLPREADLAAELGLSRNSLREAVKALTLVNVLDVRQGDGTYATSLAPSLLLEALSFIIDFHRDDTVLEFLEVRRILEPAATALAALRMSAQDKAELGKILDAVTVESPVDDFVATDLEFHKKIAVGAGNSVLASLVDNMSLPTARARIWRGMTEPRALERTLDEHRAIHGAILSGDADLARSWATVHIAGIETWLRTTLTDLPAPRRVRWRDRAGGPAPPCRSVLLDDALEHRRLAGVERGQGASQRGHQFLRLLDPLAVGVAGRGEGGVVRRPVEPGAYRGLAPRRHAVGEQAVDREPAGPVAAVVQDHGEERRAPLGRHHQRRGRHAEQERAVAGHRDHPAVRAGELHSQ
jgi:DNA-binding FadR family transcriptional regulator